MKPISELSDDDIDALLLRLFNNPQCSPAPTPKPIEALSDEDLLRIRSRNHPDKWPNVNQAAYQAAIEELDRRRRTKKA